MKKKSKRVVPFPMTWWKSCKIRTLVLSWRSQAGLRRNYLKELHFRILNLSSFATELQARGSEAAAAAGASTFHIIRYEIRKERVRGKKRAFRKLQAWKRFCALFNTEYYMLTLLSFMLLLKQRFFVTKLRRHGGNFKHEYHNINKVRQNSVIFVIWRRFIWQKFIFKRQNCPVLWRSTRKPIFHQLSNFVFVNK